MRLPDMTRYRSPDIPERFRVDVDEALALLRPDRPVQQHVDSFMDIEGYPRGQYGSVKNAAAATVVAATRHLPR
jgi:hypothetical protein